LLQHKQTHIHDYSAIRLIVQLVHERKRHLKYLRRLSISRYFELLDKLGLPHNYLESFDNPYLYRYRNNGDKALRK
jgi:ribosomal protein S15P/S13E